MEEHIKKFQEPINIKSSSSNTAYKVPAHRIFLRNRHKVPVNSFSIFSREHIKVPLKNRGREHVF